MAWALKWLRPERREWWCRLGPARHHLASVILLEAIRSEVTLGNPVAMYSVDELIQLVGGSRSSIARDMANLVEREFCRVDTRKGRGNRMLIGVTDPDQRGQFSGHISGQLNSADSSGESITSGAGHADDGHFPGDIDGQFPGPEDRASDQRSDLPDPRSENSGRSSSSRDLINLGRNEPEFFDPNSISLYATGELHDRPKAGKRVDVERIPERAWSAADYLRAELIKEDAACWVSRQKWVPATAIDAIGSRSGVRAKWADVFRLINERDARTWDDIAQTCWWLFNKQQLGTARFVVQSPDSLREKWDRIQAQRRNQAAPRPVQPSKFADNRPPPETRRWGTDGWGTDGENQ